jgi:hypothetical protein
MKLPLFCLAALLFATPSRAGSGKQTPPAAIHDHSATSPPNLWTGENVSLDGVLFPHVHFNAVYGGTSFNDGGAFAAGHHDPFRDGWTVQGFELGLSGRFSEHVESFVNWHGYWDSDAGRDFDSEWEEVFLKFKELPGGLEVRGGQFLNRFGLHNAAHYHAWDWADNNLVSGTMLGDDGLYTRGAEITWRLPVQWTSLLSASYGESRTELHDHSGEEESKEEHRFEAAGAAFTDHFYTLNWTNVWQVNDFHQWRGGFSGAWGDNAWGRTTQVLGAHVQYEWRKNGLEPGGDYFRWRSEAMARDADALTGHLPGEDDDADGEKDDGESLPGSFSEWGLYTSAVYGKALGRGVFEGGLRYDYLDGESDAGLPRRHRVSPVASYYFNRLRTGYVRAQVNFDDINDHGGEDSIWLSFGFNWGGSEVR